MSPLVQDSTQNDLTYRIIGAAMAVHNALGSGYKEDVYERALMVELELRGIPAQRQYPLEVLHLEYRRIFPPKNLEEPVQRVGRDSIKR